MPYIPYVLLPSSFVVLHSFVTAYRCPQFPANLARLHSCSQGTYTIPYFVSNLELISVTPQLADWLEGYARSLELNIWTSSTVTSIFQDPTSKIWTVTILRGSSNNPDSDSKDEAQPEERTFKVKHLVFALGWGGGTPSMPKYPGMVTTPMLTWTVIVQLMRGLFLIG